VSSDANISAFVTGCWESFPWADAPGQVVSITPGSIARDSRGRLFVTQGSEKGFPPGEIFVLNSRFEAEAILGSTDRCTVRIPQIRIPADIAVDSHDRLYVADWGSYDAGIHIIGPDFRYLGTVRVLGWLDESHGFVSSLAVDSRDRLVVGFATGGGKSRIAVFAANESDPTGGSMVLERSFYLCAPGEDCKGQYGDPYDITVGPSGRIIVSERTANPYFPKMRVIVLSPDFEWLESFKVPGTNSGSYLPIYSVAADPSGVIAVYAADPSVSRISFFLPNGSYAGSIGRCGSGLGEFDGIGDLLAVAPGRLLVAEFKNQRIQEVTVDLTTLRPVKPWEGVREGLGVSLAVLLAILGNVLYHSRSAGYPVHRAPTSSTVTLCLILASSLALSLYQASAVSAAGNLLPSGTGIKAYVEEMWKTIPTTKGGSVSIGG